MALILAGIGVLAFSTSIVVTAFQGKLKDLRENRVFSELERGKRYAIICGFGEIGQVVAAKLHQARQRFVVIEIDADRAQTAAKLGYLSVCGDAADNDLLETIGVQERAHTLICVTDDDVKNVFITVSARRMNDGLRIVARARTRQVVRIISIAHGRGAVPNLRAAGADKVIETREISGLRIWDIITRPVVTGILDRTLFGQADLNVAEIPLSYTCFLIGRPVVDTGLEQDYDLMLMGLVDENGDEHFLYSPTAQNKRLAPGDVLLVIGPTTAIETLRGDLVEAAASASAIE